MVNAKASILSSGGFNLLEPLVSNQQTALCVMSNQLIRTSLSIPPIVYRRSLTDHGLSGIWCFKSDSRARELTPAFHSQSSLLLNQAVVCWSLTMYSVPLKPVFLFRTHVTSR